MRACQVAVGAVAATGWAYAATVVQTPVEPGSDWYRAAGESYLNGPRDLRWFALFAAVAALLVAGRRAGAATTFAALWFGADLWLDRADPGAGSFGPVAAAAVLGVVATGWWVLRGRAPASGGWPAAVALTCAVAAPVAGLAVESAGRAVGWTVGVLLAVVAALPTRRPAPWSAVAVWALVGGLLPASPWAWLAGVLPFVAVVLAGRRSTGAGRAVAVAAGAVLAALAAYAFSAVLLMDAGRPFTALAGDPVVGMAEYDPSLALTTVVAGLVLAGGRAATRWVRAGWSERRPAAVRRREAARLTVP